MAAYVFTSDAWGDTLPFAAGHLHPGIGPARIDIERPSRRIGALTLKVSGGDGGVAKCVALFADVLQIRRTCNHLARIAGDRTQILVDCAELMVGHVPKKRPSHHLEQLAVEECR